VDAAAGRVFSFEATTSSGIGELKLILVDYLKACAGVPRIAPGVLLRLVRVLWRRGAEAEAQSLLHAIGRAHPTLPALPAAWFAFSMHAPEASPQRRERLQYLARTFEHSEFAPKARFLLQQACS
jgi:hypothetical protein